MRPPGAGGDSSEFTNNGSSLAREIHISPDGRHAALAHHLAHFQAPTTQLERGWMNTSALTLLESLKTTRQAKEVENFENFIENFRLDKVGRAG